MTFYYFVNVTKNIDDIAGKTDIKKVGILSLFESVIHANNWDSKDAIMAFPDQNDEQYDHPIMRYHNGDFEFKFKCDDCDSIDEDSCGCNDNDEGSIDGIEIDTDIDSDTKDKNEEHLDNCTYCGDILRNHAYGNICGKHIPSYALWDDMVEDSDSNYSAFYEEFCERKLAIELDEYDCGQDDYDDRYDSRSDIDQGYGYEDEGEAESCY
ncbi:MAG TPA: hypothetical protein DD806_06520 [Flavobacterium sp.]|nr:hypothetical protein [Flavobacterium sp.]